MTSYEKRNFVSLNMLYLIRHGQSEFNAVFDETGADPLVFDAPLSDLGRRQAKSVAASAQALSVDLVVLSPLTRALETGLLLFGGSNLRFCVSALVTECLLNSCDVGRSPVQLRAQFPELDFGDLNDPWWHTGVVDDRGVPLEPKASIDGRIEAFRSWIETRSEERIAVVGHTNFFYHLTGKYLENCEICRWDIGSN